MPTDTLNFLVIDVARLFRQRFDAALVGGGLGLTPGEARTLVHVRRRPGARQNELAEAMGVEPMTLIGFLDRLAAAGFIERVPDPSDRRAKCIFLTTEAGPVLEQVMAIAAGIRATATANIDDATLEALMNGLKAVRQNLFSDGKAPQ